MNLSSALSYGRKTLEDAHIADAQVDAWQLLEYICGCDRAYYYTHMDEEISKEQQLRYEECIRLRQEHVPLQHITGRAYFMGLEFFVNENVLIPRFDTEVLVEEVLKRIDGEAHVLDMCTGSGCILLSILHERPQCTGVGADISDKALEVARTNAEKLGIRTTFIQTDLFERVSEKYDIIVSNPPYIKTEIIDTLDIEVKQHEPVLALDGLEDGLYFYRNIVAKAADHLNDKGYLCFEVGYDQGEEVSALMREAGFEQVAVVKDLCGLDRVVIGGKPCLTN